jgi:hypothetical protein
MAATQFDPIYRGLSPEVGSAWRVLHQMGSLKKTSRDACGEQRDGLEGHRHG